MKNYPSLPGRFYLGDLIDAVQRIVGPDAPKGRTPDQLIAETQDALAAVVAEFDVCGCVTRGAVDEHCQEHGTAARFIREAMLARCNPTTPTDPETTE